MRKAVMNQPIVKEVRLAINHRLPHQREELPDEKVHCTEDTEEKEEIEAMEVIKEIDEIKEKEEEKESEELEEINELNPDLWEKIDKAIAESPVGNDKRFDHPLFQLARKVRGFEEEIGKRFSLEIAIEIIRRWQSINSANLDVDHDYLVELLAKLSLVRLPFGQQLAAALNSAKKQTPPKKTIRLSAELQLLACLCRDLQRRAGKEPFYLDCRSCARVLGRSHGTIATWLQALAYIGVIRLRERGRIGRASRYDYVASD